MLRLFQNKVSLTNLKEGIYCLQEDSKVILGQISGETNAPEIFRYKFVILIQALIFLFNNVAAAFLRL